MTAILQTLHFLYRVEFGTPVSGNPGVAKLGPYEMALRLSYMFWATLPDQGLMDAAKAGRLSSVADIKMQVERLLADPKAHHVTRYFYDMLFGVIGLDRLQRNPAGFPTYSAKLGPSFRQELEQFIDYVLWQGDGFLAALLTADFSFMNAKLAKFYGVAGPKGSAFEKVTVPAGKRAGFMTSAGVMASLSPGTQSNPSRGMGGLLIGQPLNSGPYETCDGNAGFANGQSIDQAISKMISAGKKFESLELAVRWPTDGRDGGKAAPTNNLNLSGPNQPIPMSTDPQAVFTRLFSDVGANATQVSQEKVRTKSILAAIGKEYQTLLPRVSTADRAKLDEHLTRVGEIETSLDALSQMNAACVKPVIGAAFDYKSDGQMPKAGQLMMDMMVMAFACDFTNVGTMQWTDSQSYNTFSWLNFNENHHAYQHDHGYHPEALKKIYNWYGTQVAGLAARLAAVQEQGQSLLDNASIFWCSEIQHPNSHAQANFAA